MDRRDLIRFGAATVAASLQPALLSAVPAIRPAPVRANIDHAGRVEQWACSRSLSGPSAGNPYKEVALTASYDGSPECASDGFYDGDGTTGCGLCRMRLDDGAM